ncbi:uncharacterized protein LOC117330741 [Pecten maximus]|uniref:uncharacterized protein LOC117330741 n=1 Tax=Pecten maximus TaxID=6579 RepID=UPI001458246A|nr:uncharacterized protein LOC117330741 [Pecten maximus]
MDRTIAIVFLQGLCSYTSAYTATYCSAQDGTALEVYCSYGCCGNFSRTTPCCTADEDSSASIPPFSIFFYALTVFILFLLIVCCVGRVARLKNRQPSAAALPGGRQSVRSGSRSQRRVTTDLSRTLVIATIENLIRIGRQSSESNQNTDEPVHPITDVPLSPPSYYDAMKTSPPDLPPPYSEVVNENLNSPPVDAQG